MSKSFRQLYLSDYDNNALIIRYAQNLGVYFPKLGRIGFGSPHNPAEFVRPFLGIEVII